MPRRIRRPPLIFSLNERLNLWASFQSQTVTAPPIPVETRVLYSEGLVVGRLDVGHVDDRPLAVFDAS